MSATDAATRPHDSRGSFGKVLAIQIVAYVVLVVLALIPGISYGNPDNQIGRAHV